MRHFEIGFALKHHFSLVASKAVWEDNSCSWVHIYHSSVRKGNVCRCSRRHVKCHVLRHSHLGKDLLEIRHGYALSLLSLASHGHLSVGIGGDGDAFTQVFGSKDRICRTVSPFFSINMQEEYGCYYSCCNAYGSDEQIASAMA